MSNKRLAFTGQYVYPEVTLIGLDRVFSSDCVQNSVYFLLSIPIYLLQIWRAICYSLARLFGSKSH